MLKGICFYPDLSSFAKFPDLAAPRPDVGPKIIIDHMIKMIYGKEPISDWPKVIEDTFQEVVLPARGAPYWDGRSTHNPHITKFGDKYLLYYMGSTHPLPDVVAGDGFGLEDPRCIVARSNKRVGLAMADSVFGSWGSVLLVYKARQYEGNLHGKMTIGAAAADSYLGPYHVLTEEPIFPPDQFHIEDPSFGRRRKGMSC